MQDRIWRTAKGELIPISKMERSHLLNCIAKIKRSRRGWRRHYLPRLELELVIRDIQGRV